MHDFRDACVEHQELSESTESRSYIDQDSAVLRHSALLFRGSEQVSEGSAGGVVKESDPEKRMASTG